MLVALTVIGRVIVLARGVPNLQLDVATPHSDDLGAKPQWLKQEILRKASRISCVWAPRLHPDGVGRALLDSASRDDSCAGS